MRKILVLFAIVLGLTGCTMNVPTNVVLSQIELPQNKVEWVSNNRSATTLDEVTIEVYKLPIRDYKYVQDEKEFLGTRTLHRGEVISLPSRKDYNWEYTTSIRCTKFNFYQPFGDIRNEINFFDYENTVGMEIVRYYGKPLKHVEDEEGWKILGSAVNFRDETNGYVNTYYFLDKNVVTKFYNEYKDGGMIVWQD